MPDRSYHANLGVTLVTGGSGGIGIAVVRAFADAGHSVAVLDRNPLPPQLVGLDPAIRYVPCDVLEEENVHSALEKASAGAGIRHLVGLAGGAVESEVAANEQGVMPTIKSFGMSLEDNLVSQYVILRAALPRLEQLTGDRSITLVSSVNALGGFGLPAYSAAKAGLIGLMHALTGPLGGSGVRINVVAPGTVPTTKTSALWSEADSRYEALLRYSALGRLGTPEDVASVIFSLASSLGHVTGQVLVVDGGQMVHRPL